MEPPPGEDLTRPSLLMRLRDHADAEAWRTFALLYAPLMYGYCRKSGLQDADAADVAQDVLKQVSRSIRGFVYDQQKGRFRDWLRTIARNKVPPLLRKAEARAGDFPAAPSRLTAWPRVQPMPSGPMTFTPTSSRSPSNRSGPGSKRTRGARSSKPGSPALTPREPPPLRVSLLTRCMPPSHAS